MNTKINENNYSNGLVGKYVIVRCHDAGVHAGYLVSHHNRECVLKDSRRLWYWKPKKGAFLSGVAVYGLEDDSTIGVKVNTIHLTENCEIIECTKESEQSINNIKEYDPE